MSIFKHSWPSESMDAVNIRAGECKLELQGTDDDLVRLEADVDENRCQDLKLDTSSRRLKVFIPHDHNAKFTLTLPRHKPWVTQIFAGKADIQIQEIFSRIQIMTGKGDIQVEDLRGTLSVVSGHTDIRVKRFVQVEIPDPPSPEPPPPTQNEPAWDWLHWDGKAWENWGGGLGEKIGWWAMDFARLFETSLITEKNPGIYLQSGSGNAEFSDIESINGLLRISRGNLEIKQAHFAKLDVNLSHGNLEGWSMVPTGDWSIRNSSGNIHLSLPSNVSARLDVGTRNGDIRSEIPLARATCQGSEQSYWKRMVGTAGPENEGTLPSIRLAANHGDVEIDSRSPPRPVASGIISRDISATGDVQENAEPGVIPEVTPLAILESLRQGKITMEEAEELLKNITL